MGQPTCPPLFYRVAFLVFLRHLIILTRCNFPCHLLFSILTLLCRFPLSPLCCSPPPPLASLAIFLLVPFLLFPSFPFLLHPRGGAVSFADSYFLSRFALSPPRAHLREGASPQSQQLFSRSSLSLSQRKLPTAQRSRVFHIERRTFLDLSLSVKLDVSF